MRSPSSAMLISAAANASSLASPAFRLEAPPSMLPRNESVSMAKVFVGSGVFFTCSASDHKPFHCRGCSALSKHTSREGWCGDDDDHRREYDGMNCPHRCEEWHKLGRPTKDGQSIDWLFKYLRLFENSWWVNFNIDWSLQPTFVTRVTKVEESYDI